MCWSRDDLGVVPSPAEMPATDVHLLLLAALRAIHDRLSALADDDRLRSLDAPQVRYELEYQLGDLEYVRAWMSTWSGMQHDHAVDDRPDSDTV